MAKKVTVAVKLDHEFVAMLNTSLSLKHPGWVSGECDSKMTAIDALAIAVCLEARGAKELQVHGAIPHEWRPHLEVVHDQRKVEVS